MSKAERRPLFRFGMRTLFVVVTVLCCWLGWQSSVVRERQALLRELRSAGIYQLIPAAGFVGHSPPGAPPPVKASVGLIRSMLGDEALQEIWYIQYGMNPPSRAELERIARVFPEAELRESLPEPCHPGCFPRGTLVHTPTGPRPIERIRPGDPVTAMQLDGEVMTAIVQSVFVSENYIFHVDTEAGRLLTTKAQPLAVAPDRVVPAGQLRLKDQLFILDSQGRVRLTAIRKLMPTGRMEKVFNLVVEGPEMLVVGDFLVRSKPPLESSSERRDH